MQAEVARRWGDTAVGFHNQNFLDIVPAGSSKGAGLTALVERLAAYVKLVGWDGQIWPVLNVKVRERDGSDCREGIDLLRRVLARRAPDGDPERLLGDQTDRVIRASGGLFRDLFRLVSALLLKGGGLPVSAAEIDGVERRQRSHIAAGLSEEQWEILATEGRIDEAADPQGRKRCDVGDP